MAKRFFLVAMVLAGAAAADEPTAELKASLSKEQIRAFMHTDGRGEGGSVLPFSILGGTTALAGGLLLTTDNKIAQGAAWPLLTIGALEIIGGLIFALREGPHTQHLDALLDSDPAEYARVERKRVFRIRDRFQPILLSVEAAICAGGGAMAIAGAVVHRETLMGVGIGLAIQGLALFLIDWAVLDRAKGYATALEMFKVE